MEREKKLVVIADINDRDFKDNSILVGKQSSAYINVIHHKCNTYKKKKKKLVSKNNTHRFYINTSS